MMSTNPIQQKISCYFNGDQKVIPQSEQDRCTKDVITKYFTTDIQNILCPKSIISKDTAFQPKRNKSDMIIKVSK